MFQIISYQIKANILSILYIIYNIRGIGLKGLMIEFQHILSVLWGHLDYMQESWIYGLRTRIFPNMSSFLDTRFIKRIAPQALLSDDTFFPLHFCRCFEQKILHPSVVNYF